MLSEETRNISAEINSSLAAEINKYQQAVLKYDIINGLQKRYITK